MIVNWDIELLLKFKLSIQNLPGVHNEGIARYSDRDILVIGEMTERMYVNEDFPNGVLVCLVNLKGISRGLLSRQALSLFKVLNNMIVCLDHFYYLIKHKLELSMKVE